MLLFGFSVSGLLLRRAEAGRRARVRKDFRSDPPPSSLVVLPWRGAARAAALLACLAVLAWLPLESAVIGGWSAALDARTLGMLALQTRLGHAWAIRLPIALVMLSAAWGSPRGRLGWLATSSALLLASFALSGHAAMHEGGLAWLHGINDAVHLLCAGIWLGSLLPLFSYLRALRDPRRRPAAALALRCFSRAGHLAVAGVLLTGCLNTWLVLETWPFHWRSPYQLLLACKIALTLLMVAIALLNRYGAVPKIQAKPEANSRPVVDLIRRRSIAALLLGCTVLALVAVLGLLEPV